MTATLAGIAALLLAHGGFAALALAMDRHHRAMRAKTRGCPRQLRPVLTTAGALALAGSLGAALRAWPPADGAAAWFGLLTVAALALVLVLTYRPRAAPAAGAAAAALGVAAATANLLGTVP